MATAYNIFRPLVEPVAGAISVATGTSKFAPGDTARGVLLASAGATRRLKAASSSQPSASHGRSPWAAAATACQWPSSFRRQCRRAAVKRTIGPRFASHLCDGWIPPRSGNTSCTAGRLKMGTTAAQKLFFNLPSSRARCRSDRGRPPAPGDQVTPACRACRGEEWPDRRLAAPDSSLNLGEGRGRHGVAAGWSTIRPTRKPPRHSQEMGQRSMRRRLKR